MKKILYIILFLFFSNCSSNKTTYWCGDHACINNKEKEEYFKKTMVIEIKEDNENVSNDESDLEKIILLSQTEKKALKKQEKLERKRKIKEEKALSKQAKLEKKRKTKEQKLLAKKLKKNKKKVIKENKENKVNLQIESGSFNDLLKKINQKNSLRPYPDINDIPN